MGRGAVDGRELNRWAEAATGEALVGQGELLRDGSPAPGMGIPWEEARGSQGDRWTGRGTTDRLTGERLTDKGRDPLMGQERDCREWARLDGQTGRTGRWS